MRYFIGQYLQNIEKEAEKEANLEKIQKLMFGPRGLIEETPTGSPTGGPTVSEKKDIVMDTIVDYRDHVFNKNNVFIFPEDDNVNSYNKQYGKIKFSGGNRKTKRRRTNKKRRSQRKKRRSQRK